MSARNYYQLQAAQCRASMRANALEARAFMAKLNFTDRDAEFAISYVQGAVVMRGLARNYEEMGRGAK